jgi:hypothetical protein
MSTASSGDRTGVPGANVDTNRSRDSRTSLTDSLASSLSEGLSTSPPANAALPDDP